MTNEELNTRMEFLLNQQAQFASDLAGIEDVVGRLANASLGRFDTVDERISALVDSQTALVDSQIRLSEAQAQTDEKLKNLIAVVDRYFSDRNGGPRP
ncbi:MAG: hypothetical protein QOD75_2591 [Blastocatellia bacterium]|jgi:LPS sulfotransferase NodH|nr:hypothetical protein [Blastocatellia bacterium]